MGRIKSVPMVWLRVTLRQLEKSARARFSDPAQEAGFQQYHSNALFGQARFGVSLGVVAWFVFAVWDVLVFPSIGGRLIAIRLLLIGPILVWLWWHLATRPHQCKPHLQRYLVIGPAAASLGLVLMMWTAYGVNPQRAFQIFWPAFSGLYFFLYAFLGLQFTPAAFVGNLTFVLVSVLGLHSGVESHMLGAALFQLGLLNFTGMLVCARSEMQQRASFRGRQHYFRQLETARRERAGAQEARDEALMQRARAESAMHLVEEERGKLAAVSDEKERFFSAAYHDLQQPLSVIGLYTHLAKSKVAGRNMPDIASDLGIIERAGHDIGLMFKGVRDRWEIGRAVPVIEIVDVDSVLQEIGRELGGAAGNKGLVLRVLSNDGSPRFSDSDRTLLKRAISNLVSNAIKYTETGGVLLGAVRCRNCIRIDVRDTGIGIPAELHRRVFEPYFQVRNVAGNRNLGLGLGLAIVRQIEKTLPGHRLTWFSRPGKGSRFSLELPIADSSAIAAARVRATPLVLPHAAMLQGKYILIVEDEAAILRGLMDALKPTGCMAEGAESAAAVEALLAERDRCPDLLITDYRLASGATGLDVVAVLHKHFDWAMSRPVLFVTGDLTPSVALADFKGPHDIYPKPIVHAELLARASRLLASLKTQSPSECTPRRSCAETATLRR